MIYWTRRFTISSPRLKVRVVTLVVYAVWLMTMESGIRFLTDYLSGDRNITNFSDERQNLYRAVNQFFLVLDIEEKKEQMQEITAAVLMKK